MDNQLVKVINESGLDKSKAQILLDNFSNYFEIAAEWESKINSLIVTDVSQIAEMKMAREARLFLKSKRLDVESTRKQLKEQSLREGQTIDSIARILKNLIEPIEEKAEQIEKFKEIQEEKMLNERLTERIEKLIPFGVAIDSAYLKMMPEDNFATYLTGLQVEAERKAEEERRAEEERIAKEKAEAEERERIRIENERLKKEAEAREKEIAAERAKAEEERKAAEAEKKRLEEIARNEREAAEAKLKAEHDAARKAAEKAAEERHKLEAELKAKEEAEKAAKKAEQDRIIAEEKERRLAEKKAAAAPDKTKLLDLANLIDAISKPVLKTDEAINILNDANTLLIKVSAYIREKSNIL